MLDYFTLYFASVEDIDKLITDLTYMRDNREKDLNKRGKGYTYTVELSDMEFDIGYKEDLYKYRNVQ